MNLSRAARIGTLALAGLSLAACGGPLSALDPAGPAAAHIAQIWNVMLVGATLLFLLVMVLFALAFLKPQWRWSERAGFRWLLYGGFVMPLTVLTALLFYALAGGERLLAHPEAEGLVRVEAEARRWQWTFRYPDAEGAGESVDVLHIPAGRPVDVVITSRDVIHSFWVPRLGGKLDAIPGHTNILRIEADTEGTYGGICSEYCGFGHAAMSFTVVAHPPEDYEAALAAQEAGQ
ncbi:cytochrome c oxidase subunit II [Aureimonas populi]|uniref:Cytochrome aa3 subunit 2 n=1 Tax=Aureimonas populi TaxID=1701758 RepID=A0ABW5CLY7_9HYPH|nr:cytochrome c oxidase subunit II [Aureimonas populi]